MCGCYYEKRDKTEEAVYRGGHTAAGRGEKIVCVAFITKQARNKGGPTTEMGYAGEAKEMQGVVSDRQQRKKVCVFVSQHSKIDATTSAWLASNPQILSISRVQDDISSLQGDRPAPKLEEAELAACSPSSPVNSRARGPSAPETKARDQVLIPFGSHSLTRRREVSELRAGLY
ncbi:hypothetical protein PM082_003556 [Marasmius tenuissimus]|nr:hypothetical protein PM082_003556 [Marasmius tenuissimus]